MNGQRGEGRGALDGDGGSTVSCSTRIRPLAHAKTLNAGERDLACRQLGLKPSRLYQLLGQFRRTPVTSSLLDETSGPGKERRFLSPEQEAAVTRGIQETCCRRERPTVTSVHAMFEWFAASETKGNDFRLPLAWPLGNSSSSPPSQVLAPLLLAQVASHLKLRPEPEYRQLASDIIRSQA